MCPRRRHQAQQQNKHWALSLSQRTPFTHTPSIRLPHQPQETDNHRHLHFIDRETEAEEHSDSSEVTQLVSNRARTQAVRCRHPNSQPPKQVADTEKGLVPLGVDPLLGISSSACRTAHTIFTACRAHLESHWYTLVCAEAPSDSLCQVSSAFEALLCLSPLPPQPGAGTPTSLLGQEL